MISVIFVIYSKLINCMTSHKLNTIIIFIKIKIKNKKIKKVNCLLKVILCASEHICSIVRYCFRSFKQL